LPLPIRNADEPGRIPYQSTKNNTGACPATGTCFFNFGLVPAGRRIVIQRITGLNGFVGTPDRVTVLLNNGSGLPLQHFYAPFVGSASFFTQEVLSYFDAGQLIEVQINAFPATHAGGLIAQHVTLSGYILDCSTAGSCAPIAH
jgi:hypothetical protein